jgi:hypothetical protein
MKSILILLMLTAFAQAEITTFTVAPFSAIIAKSAKIEQRTTDVAVFLTERVAGEQSGVFLTIASDWKFVTPYIDVVGVKIEPSKTTKSMFNMYAPPGKYKILLVESDPEKGLIFSNREVVVGTPTVTDPPVVVPGDFAALIKATKDNATRLNDPKTRAELKAAYSDVMPLIVGKSYDECKSSIVAARFFVFNSRQGLSRLVDWDSWRVAVDAELVKVVKVGDTAGYIKAMSAIINAL